MNDQQTLSTLEQSLFQTVDIQNALTLETKNCVKKHKEMSSKRIELASQSEKDGKNLSMTRNASTICHWISTMTPWGLFATLPISNMGMFSIACAGKSALLQSIVKRTKYPKKRTVVMAKIIETAALGLSLGSLFMLPTPMGLAAKTFSTGMAFLTGGISLYGDRCQKKLSKKELQLQSVDMYSNMEEQILKNTNKAFSASMRCDASSLALIRKISILNAQCMNDVLKAHG